MFFEAMVNSPPDRLFVPAANGNQSVHFAYCDDPHREHRIWEGYLDACCILLDQMMARRAFSQNLIFPALFNLRHGIEAALKWHIVYAGGTIPANAGHNLGVLIRAFRQTADGLDEDASYLCEYSLDLIAELGAFDPDSITFRYATKLDGSPINLSAKPWDFRCLCFTVDWLSIWFDHLSGYIDMSSEDFQAMFREANEVSPKVGHSRRSLVTPTQSFQAASTYSRRPPD